MSADGQVRFGIYQIDGAHKSIVTKVSPSTEDFQFCNNIFVRGTFMSFDIGKSRIDGGWDDGEGHPAAGFITMKDNHGGMVFAAVKSAYLKARTSTTAFILVLDNPTYTNSNQLVG